MSKRKIIREKIKSLLINKTECNDKVYENRIAQWWPEKLPAISIYSRSESSEIWNVAPRKYKRKINISVEIVHVASDDIDDKLDLICDQVEAILNGDDTLQGVCDDVIYQGTQLSIVEDAKELFAVAKLDYEVTYASYHGINPNDLPQINEHHTTVKAGENLIESNVTLQE